MSDTRQAVLEALAGGAVSGPALAEKLGVSRAAVWKQIDALRDEGFTIESTGEGYEVSEFPAYGGSAVAFGLDAPVSVEYHDSLGSTNDRGRELAAAGAADVAVLAGEQTGGRGRLSREWSAPVGGVWLSLVLQPSRPPAHVPLFTLAAAVATTRAAREAGVPAEIKWPNDVLVPGANDGDASDDADEEDTLGRGGRKLAGVLTEMEGEADRVSWLVVGIGVNANVDADSLPAGATSIREEAGDVDRRVFVQRLVEEFYALRDDPDAVLPAWREYSATLGRRVRIETPGGVDERRSSARQTKSGGVVEGEAVDVVHPGALVVATDDGEVTVHAGDCVHLRSA